MGGVEVEHSSRSQGRPAALARKDGSGLAAVVIIVSVLALVPVTLLGTLAAWAPSFWPVAAVIPVGLSICAAVGFRREFARRDVDRMLQAGAGLLAAAGMWVAVLLPTLTAAV